MKTKTILELLTLTSSLYILAKDNQILEKISTLSEKGKAEIDKIISESQLDENGKELEFIDKVVLKIQEFKEELNEKDMVLKLIKQNGDLQKQIINM